MGYKDPERQREYQRVWIAKRREKWLDDKSCVICGSTDRLEIDHIDRSQKWKHNFWSYSWDKINAELAKCQVLCWKHHKDKTVSELKRQEPYEHGTNLGYAKMKCGCAPCKTAKREYQRQYRKLKLNKT